MKTFAFLVVVAQALSWVEASNCRASNCNAGIAKAVKCNTNKPGQCANAIGCQYFYSTTVYRGCSTTTLTVYPPQKTVTRAAQQTIITTKNQPVVQQTLVDTETTIDTVLTETSSETTAIATETETTVTTVSTETSTITEFTATATISETDTTTSTTASTLTTSIPPQVGPAFPGNQKREVVRTKHLPTPAELAELQAHAGESVPDAQSVERRNLNNYAIPYPQYVPNAVKSCLNPRSYSAACGCFGAQAKTVVKPSTTETVKITRTKPAVTITKTNVVTSTATDPQITKVVTITTTLIQLATETTTETSSVTATTIETDPSTAEESTTLSTDTATTTTTTATETTTEIVATATQTSNPFPAGGTCGCQQGYEAGTRISNPSDDYFFSTSIEQSFADCARVCDTVFSCNFIEYNLFTGECKQANQSPPGTASDSNYYLGTVVFDDTCGRGCAG